MHACYVPAKSLQSCPTLCDPMDWSPPGSSLHGILLARILEWVAMPSCRASSQPRGWTCVSWGRRGLYHWCIYSSNSFPRNLMDKYSSFSVDTCSKNVHWNIISNGDRLNTTVNSWKFHHMEACSFTVHGSINVCVCVCVCVHSWIQ